MEDLTFFVILLSLVWFLMYWVLGGVFFAIVTLLRFGRVRKTRFGCLFSVLALICGIGAAWTGFQQAESALRRCLPEAETQTDVISAIFGCGFIGVFGMFLVWAAVLVLGGFLIMAFSKTKTRPWIDIDHSHRDEPVVSEQGNYFNETD